MNKSQKKFVRQVQEQVARSLETRYKSRGLPPPTITHGAITPPRNNSIPVVTQGNKVDLEQYEDFE